MPLLSAVFIYVAGVEQMDSKIDFKGKKFAVIFNKNNQVCILSDHARKLTGDSILTVNPELDQSAQVWNYRNYTLHTNPDYKEKEMNSNKLADEIMEKSKEPVYTQEMKNKDLVPTEGMKFTYRKRDEEYTVLGVCESQNGKSTIITFEDFRNSIDCIYYSEDVLPIDQRTDSEKAINAIDLSITDTNNSLTDTYKLERNFSTESIALLQKIKAGEVYGVSFTGDKK